MVVPPTPLNVLRKELRKRRQTVASEQRSTRLARVPMLDEMLARAQSVGCYHALRGEPDPFLLIDRIHGRTALPSVRDDSLLMTFRSWARSEPLVQANWGGWQPLDSAIEVVPDLILVPLLGFDTRCNRIGQGGGYYDRYLAAHPSACRIGIAWDCQRIDRIDARTWDVALDAVLTETAFYVKDLTRCQHL